MSRGPLRPPADVPARTWDGLQIAADRPTGATVVVRRTLPTGEREVLALHRKAHGPDFAGDWAWTSPAGCRQPGEPVYPAALRELAEEAGITGVAPWAVDLSGPWSVFAVDVAADLPVELVDPEHDAYVWLSPGEAAARVRPAFVSEQQNRAALVSGADLRFRPMVDTDLGLVARWQQTPHVRQWWDDECTDEASARAKYGPSLRGDDPTRMWVVEVDGQPAGFLQDYRVSDDAGYAASVQDPEGIGFDYAIGVEALVGRGLGTRMIWEFCRDILRPGYPDAAHFLASPSQRNARSLRVLEKCGFSQGLLIDGEAMSGKPPEPEIVCTLDVAHWLG